MAKKRYTLTIFLLKEKLSLEKSIKSGGCTQYPVNFRDGIEGTLYVASSRRNVPSWYTLLSPVVLSLPQLLTSNASALLIVPHGDRLFAISFGYGRTLLELGTWEEDFGLKVTLNSVTKLRIVDRMSFDAIGQHSRIQASREADLAEFGLDLDQDMLRAVGGRPTNPELGSRLDGKDALRASVACDANDLPHLLALYYNQWQGVQYREHFSWIDQIRDVKSLELKNELDEILLEKIRDGEFDNVWLCIPEILDWASIDGFTYRDRRSAPIHTDVHLQAFLSDVSREQLDISYLERRQIKAVDANGEKIKRWTVYRCLYAELEHENRTFVLTNGKWYAVGDSFIERVNRQYEAIQHSTVALPEYDGSSDASEGNYNARVYAEDSSLFALMDGKHIVCDGPMDKVEFCDLFSRDKQLIHVKRYAGSSAPLSHLFAQSLISSTAFRRSHEFRVAANKLLPETFPSILSQPQNNEYEVVLGIISKSQRPLRLPFFSRVNLNSVKDRIQDLGFRLTILKVQAIN